jgi:hypothetical protein
MPARVLVGRDGQTTYVPQVPLFQFIEWLDATICRTFLQARPRWLIPIVGLIDGRTVRLHWPGGRRPMPELPWIVRLIKKQFPGMEIDTHGTPACVMHEDCAEVVKLGRECWKSRHP